MDDYMDDYIDDICYVYGDNSYHTLDEVLEFIAENKSIEDAVGTKIDIYTLSLINFDHFVDTHLKKDLFNMMEKMSGYVYDTVGDENYEDIDISNIHNHNKNYEMIKVKLIEAFQNTVSHYKKVDKKIGDIEVSIGMISELY